MPKITAQVKLFPTEDKEKVRQSLLAIFPDSDIEESESGLKATTASGDRLRQIILDSHIRDSARSVMFRGKDGNAIRFRLNKQAAFMGKVSFLEGGAALGGIDVTVEDEDLDGTIDFLAESTVEGREQREEREDEE